MAHNTVITWEKPVPHLALSDWNARVNQLRNVADARRGDAFDIRQCSRNLRNETRIEADWINYETNEALAERIAELARWRETVARTLDRIVKEVKMLEEEKASTERELEAMQTPISVVGECLTMRDCRLGSELTYDDADTEIKNELAVIENNQRLLADQCQKAWEKLNRLEEVKFKLGLEVENKAEAEVVDVAQLDLNKFAANITYKPDPLRNPKNCSTYQGWLEHTKNIKQLAENELADTYAIRETLFVCREKARNMLLSQQDRAEHAIRKRIFETQRARNELEWQQMKMKEEMEKTVCEIKTLEQALRDKADALKLAETRLENRAQRSGMELCLDEAHDQLCLEVQKLRDIRRRLMDRIDETKANYNLLEEHAQKIDVDLENKQHSLMTDIRALDLRQRLKGGEFSQKQQSPSAQTDRNIVLTKMEKEIPKN
ncbi:tektin-B1 [Rhagoletis pomonella]|uniref:tektin-B1 n=1 Tax=Rhagoletis pomonella TaxID=28610 RepID=UPI00177BB852|nr:tektin-B1 [Rhagoletis pomonella]